MLAYSCDLGNFIGGEIPAAFSALLRIFQELKQHGRATVAAVEDICSEMKASPHIQTDSTEFKLQLLNIVYASLIPEPQARLKQLSGVELAKITSRLDGSNPEYSISLDPHITLPSQDVRSGRAVNVASVEAALRLQCEMMTSINDQVLSGVIIDSGAPVGFGPVLFVELSRIDERSRKKLRHLVPVNERLNVYGVWYRLRSVTVHQGENGYGHCYTYVFEDSLVMKWNDGAVHEVGKLERDAVLRGGQEDEFEVMNCQYIREQSWAAVVCPEAFIRASPRDKCIRTSPMGKVDWESPALAIVSVNGQRLWSEHNALKKKFEEQRHPSAWNPERGAAMSAVSCTSTSCSTKGEEPSKSAPAGKKQNHEASDCLEQVPSCTYLGLCVL